LRQKLGRESVEHALKLIDFGQLGLKLCPGSRVLVLYRLDDLGMTRFQPRAALR
jgi:hypothetical protein